jgi:hypothetical protein
MDGLLVGSVEAEDESVGGAISIEGNLQGGIDGVEGETMSRGNEEGLADDFADKVGTSIAGGFFDVELDGRFCRMSWNGAHKDGGENQS